MRRYAQSDPCNQVLANRQSDISIVSGTTPFHSPVFVLLSSLDKVTVEPPFPLET